MNIELYSCQTVVKLFARWRSIHSWTIFEVSNNEAIQMWNKLSRINVVVIPFSHFFLRVAMKRCSFTFLDNFEHKRSIYKNNDFMVGKPRIFLKFLSQTGFNQHIFKVKVAAHLSVLDNYQLCKWLSVTIHQQGTV